MLGILAAVVIFALGGITSKSAVAACQADGATVATAISALSGNFTATVVAAGKLGGVSGASSLFTGAEGQFLMASPVPDVVQ